jgi:hypothetical protein
MPVRVPAVMAVPAVHTAGVPAVHTAGVCQQCTRLCQPCSRQAGPSSGRAWFQWSVDGGLEAGLRHHESCIFSAQHHIFCDAAASRDLAIIDLHAHAQLTYHTHMHYIS